MKRVVLAAGGTGGHLFPAQSVGMSLTQRGDHTFYVTDHRGERFFHTEEKPFYVMNLRRAGGFFGTLRFLYLMARETWRCVQLFRQIQPQIVMGFGSYASVPPVLAAQLMRIPTLLHEQNAILGRANRYLSWASNRVACSFEKTAVASSGNIVWTGNPLRQTFFNSTSYSDLPQSPLQIVVVGGSQGSRIFSQVIPKAIMQLSDALQGNLVVHQHARPEDNENVKKIYAEFKGQVIIKDFFHNMSELYNNAHLVISRAGACTVSELCIMGRPAILVPFGASIEGDQLYNASYLADRQACIMMREYEFTARNLKKVLEDVLPNSLLRLQLATNIKQLAVPDAVQRLLAVMDQQVQVVA